MKEIQKQFEARIYNKLNVVTFRKTKESFGALSNMAGGFPIIINGSKIRTSEALYQVCRYPHLPEVQAMIINEVSPMTAKMKSKPYKQKSREDWEDIRVMVMRWCLRVKLLQNMNSFFSVIESTSNKKIVEESHKDAFWGAKPIDENILKGVNALGRLLMELREEFSQRESGIYTLNPPRVKNFLLLEKPIRSMSFEWAYKSIKDGDYSKGSQITFKEL